MGNKMLMLPARLGGHFLAQRKLRGSVPQPVFLNFSITNRCQSKCVTCNIWKLYTGGLDQVSRREEDELRLEEIEKIFKSMDPIMYLAICGGEPTLRDDLPNICALAEKHLHPDTIHFPTNCLAPKRLEDLCTDILQRLSPDTKFSVKLSIDGIGENHDAIRGISGNFAKVIEAHDRLIALREKHKNFYLDAGTTVGNHNVDQLSAINDYVRAHFKLDNFINEIADLRTELFNNSMDIRPTGESYAKALAFLKRTGRERMKTARFFSRYQEASRLVYYERAAAMLQTGKRQAECFASYTNCHLSPWGDIWPCNVQAQDKTMGNVRYFNYDFKALWRSPQAESVRQWIGEKHCACPLVGQGHVDNIMNPRELMKLVKTFIFS